MSVNALDFMRPCTRCGEAESYPGETICAACMRKTGHPGAGKTAGQAPFVPEGDAASPVVPVPTAEAEEASTGAIDVTDLEGDFEEGDLPMVVCGLLGPKEVIVFTGEEGDGKTTASDQFVRQLHRGEDVFGFFPVGELCPTSTLFVDTHQEEPEIRRRVRDMKTRGLEVERGQIHWWWSGGLDLVSSDTDRTTLEREVERTGAQFVWIDAASHMVNDSKDDVEVGKFFDYLSDLMRRYDLLGVGLTLFPRKRPSGEYGRRFDDLFGSREWKGRITTALYLDANKVTCWKDRAHRVRRVWPVKNRYATALLHRPGLEDDSSVPFVIEVAEVEDEVDRDAIRAKVLELAETQPATYTKSSLAQAAGGNRTSVLGVIEELLSERVLGPAKSRAKLSIQGPTLG